MKNKFIVSKEESFVGTKNKAGQIIWCENPSKIKTLIKPCKHKWTIKSLPEKNIDKNVVGMQFEFCAICEKCLEKRYI